MRFTENCHKLGLTIHGDFIVGLPGRNARHAAQDHRIRQEAGRRDHSGFTWATRFPAPSSTSTPRPTAWSRIDGMTDESGHQLPNAVYPGFDRGELVEWVERFYSEYYFRPKAVWRVVSERHSQQRSSASLQRGARVSVRELASARSSSKNRRESAGTLAGAEESVS